MKYSYQNLTKQSGVTLLVAIVLLLIMSMIAVTSLTTSTLEEKMAINTQNQISTFQAAESGIDNAIHEVGTLSAAANTKTLQSVTVTFSSSSISTSNVDITFVRADQIRDDAGRTAAAYETGTSWDNGSGNSLGGSVHFEALGSAQLISNPTITSSIMQGFSWGVSDR